MMFVSGAPIIKRNSSVFVWRNWILVEVMFIVSVFYCIVSGVFDTNAGVR